MFESSDPMSSRHAYGASTAKIRMFPTRLMGRGCVRDLFGLPSVLGRIGSLELRLATTKKEIRKAQRLRYRVFFEEGSAVPDRTAALIRRDVCRFDRVCDHLLVVDLEARGKRLGIRKQKIVGTYRLLRQDVADLNFGFYSAAEFDIAPLLARQADKRFLELGRSCVLKDYRNKRTVELLWRGIWAYVNHHRIDAMMGCASLEGTNPLKLALPLSYLHHCAGARDEWNARALPERYVPMDIIAADGVDRRRALASLPPLVKGYLRLGATFGKGAVIDHQFGTTDVLVVLPVEDVQARYTSHMAHIREGHAA